MPEVIEKNSQAGDQAVSAPANNEEEKVEVKEPEAPESETPEQDKGAAPKKKGAEQRIKQLVAEREYYRGLAEGRATMPGQQAAPVKPQGPPTLDQYENYEDFLIAKAKYEIRQEDAQGGNRQQQAQKDIEFQTKMHKALSEDPELLEIYNDPGLPISDAMTTVIKESDIAPELVRYFGLNRDEALKIYHLSPMAAAREIGKIEAKLTLPPPDGVKKISGAPQPIKTVGDKGSQSVDIEKLPMEEFVKRRNAEQYKRR